MVSISVICTRIEHIDPFSAHSLHVIVAFVSRDDEVMNYWNCFCCSCCCFLSLKVFSSFDLLLQLMMVALMLRKMVAVGVDQPLWLVVTVAIVGVEEELMYKD